MLNLLQKLKSYMHIALIFASLGAIAYGWYWHSQYNASQARNAQLIQQLATSKANQELLQSGVQRWKAAAAQYDQQLKRTEALVAKHTAESDQRVKYILQTQYSSDCTKAMQQGLAQLVDDKFIWNNNIP